ASEEEFTTETAAWLSYRTAEPAARELLAVAAASDPASRILAVGVVITEIGAPAEPVWREVLGQAELRTYAKAALITLSGDDPAAAPPGLEPDDHDLAWMITDALTVIGKRHPDKKIAKLARKSAYKAASRQAGRRQ